LAAQVQDLQGQQSTFTAQKRTNRSTIHTLESKISDLTHSIDALASDESELTLLKDTKQSTSNALQTAQGEFTEKSWDTQLASIEVQISTVDEQIKMVQMELTSTSAQSEFRAKLDVLKSDLAKKSQSRNMLVSSHAERFKKHVGNELKTSTGDSQINVPLRRKTDDLTEAQGFLSGTEKQISQYEAKLVAAKESLRDKRKEKKQAHLKVMNATEEDINSFPDVVKNLEDSLAQCNLYILL
jgi:hypothetical protein